MLSKVINYTKYGEYGGVLPAQRGDVCEGVEGEVTPRGTLQVRFGGNELTS